MEQNNTYSYKEFSNNIKYSNVIRIGKLLFILGERPIDYETGEFITNDFKEALKACMANLLSDMEVEGINIEDITRITVYIKNKNNLNALDEFLFTFFKGSLPVKKIVEIRGEEDLPVWIDIMAIAR